MNAYVISLLVGMLVGVIYAAMQVRSPAPPLVALVGLLGILLGEGAFPVVKAKFFPGAPVIAAPDAQRKQ